VKLKELIDTHLASVATTHGIDSQDYQQAQRLTQEIWAEAKRLNGLWLDAVDKKASESMRWSHRAKEYKQASAAENQAYEAAMRHREQALHRLGAMEAT